MGILPTEPNIPMLGIPKETKMLLEGKSKIGKTTFAASFPDSLVLELERGGDDYIHTPVLKLYFGQDPLKGLRMAIDELRQGAHKYKSVVLDTVDALADLVAKEICAELKIATIADAPKGARHGVQWERYAMTLTGIIGALIALPYNVIITGHTKPASYDEKGVMRTPEGLDIYGKAARILYARVDNIGHMYVVNEGGKTKTVLSFKGGMDCTRGSRHPKLRDKEIIIPEPPASGYATFERLFKDESKEAVK